MVNRFYVQGQISAEPEISREINPQKSKQDGSISVFKITDGLQD